MNTPSIPHSWSDLTWHQLCDCWQVKLCFGANHDAARAAALLALCGMEVCRKDEITEVRYNEKSGERLFVLRDRDRHLWTVTPRELSQMAKQTLKWFDYPYGDPGEKEDKDEHGNVVKEAREAVGGYVNPDYDKRDALALPIDTLTVCRRHFAMPQVACINYTWQQYRALQGLSSMLFQNGITEEQTLALQAQFVAHSLVPRSPALFDTNAGTIRFRPHYEYQYNPTQADELAKWWEKLMKNEERRMKDKGNCGFSLFAFRPSLFTLFHICFQAYHTAILQYEKIYPLLFSGSGRSDPLHTAISGESNTLNAVMKYAGYASQQEVYDSNLPFVLDILNTMTKEAKEIEKMNAKIKKK